MVPCVIWRRDADRLGHELEDGQSVIAFGSIGHYAAGGRYQFYVRGAELAGIGEKYLQVERWRRELGAEGCFQEFRKRGLPRYPARVGVVTSSTGAVLHDIVNVLRRRFPVELVLSPTAVQGDGAELEIAAAIRRVDGDGRRDHRRARRGVVRGPLRLQPSGRRPGGLCLRDAGRLGRRARGRRDPLRPRGRPPCPHPVGRGRAGRARPGRAPRRPPAGAPAARGRAVRAMGARRRRGLAICATGSARHGSHSGSTGGARNWPSSTPGSGAGATARSSAGGPSSRGSRPCTGHGRRSSRSRGDTR